MGIPEKQFVVVKEPVRILPVYELIIKLNGDEKQPDTRSKLGGSSTVPATAANVAQISSLGHAMSRIPSLRKSVQLRRQQADRAAAAAERRRQSAIVLQQTALHWPIHDPNVVRSIPYLPQPIVPGTSSTITSSATSSSGAVTRSSTSPSNVPGTSATITSTDTSSSGAVTSRSHSPSN